MLLIRFIEFLSLATVVLCAPTTSELRLVRASGKTQWISEEEKISLRRPRGPGFVDITDTMEIEELSAMSRKAAPVYPAGAVHQSEAAPFLKKLRQINMEIWAREMTSFYTRYYDSHWGTLAGLWMYATVKKVTWMNPAIKVTQWKHKYNQPSIIAKIPGKSSTGTVIVSAHYDSVGSTITGRAPGADDNASGVVVLLEALRVLAQGRFKPKNDLEFHFYSGEEGGLLGSRDIMLAYQKQKVNVLALVNQDMTGYSPNNVIAVFTDDVSPELTEYITKIVPAYSSLPVLLDACGYEGCSDHASATAAGFPASYVCDEGMEKASPYIHSANDTLSTLSFPHILEHTKFTVGFLVEGAYF